METFHCIARTNAPSSASGTFSPTLKSAWGRRTLDEHCGLRFHLDGEKSGLTVPSPQPHPLRRREVQFLSRLHIEGLVPLIDVADGVGAVLAGGVAVGHQ
jgi:hypothetical protein